MQFYCTQCLISVCVCVSGPSGFSWGFFVILRLTHTMQTLLVLSLLWCYKTSEVDLHWLTHKTHVPLNDRFSALLAISSSSCLSFMFTFSPYLPHHSFLVPPFHLRNNKSYISTITFWVHFESCWSLFALAVPAPTELGFGLVGSDSMEVTWVSPRVPNVADINSFLVRYEQKCWFFFFKD